MHVERCEQRQQQAQQQAQHRAKTAALQAAKDAELAAMGITYVQYSQCPPQAYYDVPIGVKPPDWMLAPDYKGVGWRMYSGSRLLKSGPVIDCAHRWLRSGWEEER